MKRGYLLFIPNIHQGSWQHHLVNFDPFIFKLKHAVAPGYLSVLYSLTGHSHLVLPVGLYLFVRIYIPSFTPPTRQTLRWLVL
jgi:hypothetical protein